MFIHMSRTWCGALGGGVGRGWTGAVAGGGRPRNRRARRRTEISNIRTARREAGQMSTVLTAESARARDVRLAWFHYKNVTHRAAPRRAAPRPALALSASRRCVRIRARLSLPLSPSLSLSLSLSLSGFLFLSLSLSLSLVPVSSRHCRHESRRPHDETREAVDLILPVDQRRPSINARSLEADALESSNEMRSLSPRSSGEFLEDRVSNRDVYVMTAAAVQVLVSGLQRLVKHF